MTSFKSKLKAAKEFYVQQKYHEALERCKSALQDNDESPDALLLQGKVLFELKHFQQSGNTYKAILKFQPDLLPAWKGLAELYTATKDAAAAIEVYESLIRLGSSESKDRRQQYHLKLATSLQHLGRNTEAIEHLEKLLHGPLACSDQQQHLEVECQLAIIQVYNHTSFITVDHTCGTRVRCEAPALRAQSTALACCA